MGGLRQFLVHGLWEFTILHHILIIGRLSVTLLSQWYLIKAAIAHQQVPQIIFVPVIIPDKQLANQWYRCNISAVLIVSDYHSCVSMTRIP